MPLCYPTRGRDTLYRRVCGRMPYSRLDLTSDSASLPLGLADVSMGYAGGALDPATYVARCIERIADRNGAIGAVIGLDLANARPAAAASAMRWRTGTPRSPIDGAPFLIKANIAVAGMPWHAGVQAYDGRIAATDAPCVARLRAAGAVILGLTNMDEAALGARGENAWLGRIANPRKPGSSAGGSSGGSAAAVAAGLCAAALGSDTVGSVMIPAAFCGVVGHRASRPVLPVDQVVPLSPTLDHLGWHTRSVADSLMLLQALGGAKGDVARSRVAVLVLDGLDIDPAVAEAFDAAVERVRRAGHPVDPVRPDVSIVTVARLLFEIAEIEAASVHETVLDARPEGFSPALRRMLEWGRGPGAAAYPGHLQKRGEAASALRRDFAGHDVVLMPTTPRPAFAMDATTPGDQALFTALPACLGWPATAVPIGQCGGLPLSAMAIGPADAMTHRVAAALSLDRADDRYAGLSPIVTQ